MSTAWAAFFGALVGVLLVGSILAWSIKKDLDDWLRTAAERLKTLPSLGKYVQQTQEVPPAEAAKPTRIPIVEPTRYRPEEYEEPPVCAACNQEARRGDWIYEVPLDGLQVKVLCAVCGTVKA